MVSAKAQTGKGRFLKKEVVEDGSDVRALFQERLFKIRVHVQRDGIDMAHPIHTDMLDEVVNDLLLFPLCNPEGIVNSFV